MPQRLRILLRGDLPRNPHQHAAGLRKVVRDWIAAGDADLNTALHDANSPKPYTISPLWDTGRPDAPLCVEVGAPADWIAERLRAGVEAAPEELRMGTQWFLRAGVEAALPPRTWSELFEQGPGRPDDQIVRLVTPTAHHAPQLPEWPRKALSSPAPETYFRSWWDRWNRCAPPEWGLDEGLLALVEAHVALTAFAGETAVEHLDQGRPFIGFVGWVRFGVLDAPTVRPDAARLLAALERFAEYCGTGVETLRGMGQTYVVPVGVEGVCGEWPRARRGSGRGRESLPTGRIAG